MIAHDIQHNGVTFGLRVLVHRVVIRVKADARYDLYEDGRCVRVFKELRDERRQPATRGQAPRHPTWPGEPIPAPDGYEQEPQPRGVHLRLRRIPPSGGHPNLGVVLGGCLRYEGTYYPWDTGEGEREPPTLEQRRAIRLVEIAFPGRRPHHPARLALALPVDLELAQ